MKPSPEQRAWDCSRVAHKQLRGVSITIQRGSSLTPNVVATVGFTGEQMFEGDGGFNLVTDFRDYIIDVADYKIDGVVTDPAINDRIIQVVNGKTCIFEVLHDGTGTHADHDDTNQTFWRVHTKEIEQ